MAKKIGSVSKNSQRKASYQKMGWEQGEKESRNRAIEEALGRGHENIEAKGGTHVDTVALTYEELEEGVDFDGRKIKNNRKTRQVRIETSKELIDPGMPTSGTRAAKRARLKASRNKQLADVSHPHGTCGNIGCKRCSPIAAKMDRIARPHAKV